MGLISIVVRLCGSVVEKKVFILNGLNLLGILRIGETSLVGLAMVGKKKRAKKVEKTFS